MFKKFFDNKIPPNCKHCVHGMPSAFNDEIICSKRGITDSMDSCKSYKYDPLKRKPNKVKIANNYKPEDFSL